MKLQICWECWPRIAVAVLLGAVIAGLLLPAREQVAP